MIAGLGSNMTIKVGLLEANNVSKIVNNRIQGSAQIFLETLFDFRNKHELLWIPGDGYSNKLMDGSIDILANMMDFRTLAADGNLTGTTITHPTECVISHSADLPKTKLLGSLESFKMLDPLLLGLILVIILTISTLLILPKDRNIVNIAWLSFKLLSQQCDPHPFIPNNRFKSIHMSGLGLMVVMTLIFTCHFSADLSVKVKSEHLKNIRQLGDWPFQAAASGLGFACFKAFNFEGMSFPEAMKALQASFVFYPDLMAIDMLGQMKTGRILAIFSSMYLPIYDFVFCNYYQNRLLRHSEPFGTDLGLFVYNRKVDQKKRDFIEGYAYSILENGIIFKVISRIKEANQRIYKKYHCERDFSEMETGHRGLGLKFFLDSIWILLGVNVLISCSGTIYLILTRCP